MTAIAGEHGRQGGGTYGAVAGSGRLFLMGSAIATGFDVRIGKKKGDVSWRIGRKISCAVSLLVERVDGRRAEKGEDFASVKVRFAKFGERS